MRRFAAFVALLGIVLGSPAALTRLGFYSWGDLNVWVAADYRVLLGALTLAGWAAWAVFTVSLTTEIVNLASRGRLTLRLPGLRWPQAIAAALLATVLATGAAPALNVSSAPPAVTQAVRAASDSTTAEVVQEGHEDAEQQSVRTTDDGVSLEGAGDPVVVHLIRDGEDLWSLAQRYYGSGDQWRRIVAANPGITDPLENLRPGSALVIVGPVDTGAPTSAHKVAQPPVLPMVVAEAEASTLSATSGTPTDNYVVQPGDTLWKLAEQRLGDGNRYPELVELNRTIIRDADHIETGWVLSLPTPTTVPGDTPGDAPTTTPTPKAVPVAPILGADGRGIPRPGVDIAADEGAQSSDGSAATTGGEHSPVDSSAQASASVPQSLPTAVRAEPSLAAPTISTPQTAPPFNPSSLLDQSAIRITLGGLGAAGAAVLIGTLLARRRERAMGRPLGQTHPADASLTRFESALGLKAADAPGLIRDAAQSAPTGCDDEGLAERAAPGRVDLLARGMRILAEQWWLAGVRPAVLRRAVLQRERLVIECDGEPTVTAPFVATPGRITATWADLADAADVDRAVAYPALLTLGDNAEGDCVLADVIECRVLGIEADTPELPTQSLSAMILELACSPWASDLRLMVVTSEPGFAESAALGELTCVTTPDEAIKELARVARERGALLDLAATRYDDLRLDPDQSDAWAPVIAVFEDPLTADQLGRLQRALGTQPVGVAAVVNLDAAAASHEHSGRHRLRLDRGADGVPAATFGEADDPLLVQTIDPATRAAVTRLLVEANTYDTLPASWWREDDAPDAEASGDTSEGLRTQPGDTFDTDVSLAGDTLPPRVVALARSVRDDDRDDPHAVELEHVDRSEGTVVLLRPATGTTAGAAENTPVVMAPTVCTVPQAPRVRLFGVAAIEAATGPAPAKALRRCIEYCAWLLEHPGATASELGTAMFVADGTRRSNLSRLRLWLGSDADGVPYLPDAYTGRITLHDAVTSDWADVKRLVAGGVNRVPADQLRRALSLVVGAPLADAAPGEWAWAGRLRQEMSELVRDAAVVLAQRELNSGDADAASWAVERGNLVSPDDELLACEAMKIAAHRGRPDEVAATMSRLARRASELGVDLRPQTVLLGQQLVEGSARPVLRTGSEG